MSESQIASSLLDFKTLETRFGRENARSILRTLEQFEGIRAECVTRLSYEQRLQNVFRAMSENMRYQTRH